MTFLGEGKMKKRMNNKLILSLVFSLSVLISAVSAQAQQADSYALLIQQSPPDAGSVTPGSGVHEMEIGQTVSLSAIPKPGYRFLYWLGDVSATGTPDTTIQIDSPKMVVAVFTRQAYEEELPGVKIIQGANGTGGGGGRIIGSPIRSPAAITPGSYYDPGNFIYNGTTKPIDEKEETNPYAPGDDENNGETFIPGEDGDEVPEPATILLLGLGSAVFFRRKYT